MGNDLIDRLCGLDVRVNSFIRDTPKLRFSWPEETPAMEQFNQWLLERFGTKPTYLVMGNTILTNDRGYRALLEVKK